MTSPFLSHFTPSLMSHAALEAIFVQRQQLAERLVTLTRESILTPSKHYTLLIGPRGIGKTHLLALLYHRLTTMDDLRDGMRLAWLREEEWGVTSFLELLLRIFTALSEAYPGDDLTARVAALYHFPAAEAEQQARALLREYCGSRTLVLFMENLDELFAELGEDGQQHWRAYLQEHPFCTIVATAQSLFPGVSRHTSPFYGFFRLHHLQELQFEEAVQLLIRIAQYAQKTDLVAFLQQPRGRARVHAIAHLAGGNHRVYVMLAQFLTRQSLDELVEPFLEMLDHLTPYNQARMAWLSSQQRKMVNVLCNERGALAVKDIAQRCFMSQQTAASQLKKLQQMGYVHPNAAGRESLYELREPLMRMGMEVKKSRGQPVRLFVEFLRYWYTPGELEARLELLRPHTMLDREYLRAALHLDRVLPRQPSAAGFITRELATAGATMSSGERISPVEDEDEVTRRHEDAIAVYDETITQFALATEIDLQEQVARAMGNKGYRLGALGRSEEALRMYDTLLDRFAQATAPALQELVAGAMVNKGYRLGVLGRSEEALRVYDALLDRFAQVTAPTLQELVAHAMVNKGITLGELGHSEEALRVHDALLDRFAQATAPALQKSVAQAMLDKAYRLGVLGRSEEELRVYDALLDRFAQAPTPTLQELVAHAMVNKGITLGELGHSEEALRVHDALLDRFAQTTAPALQKQVATAMVNKGITLGELGRSEEELRVYDALLDRFAQATAPALQEPVAQAMFNKGSCLSMLGRSDGALRMYDTLLDRFGQTTAPDFQKPVATSCYLRAIALFFLHRWDDALQALDDALRRFPNAQDQLPDTPATVSLRLLLTSTDAQLWPARTKALLECYDKHEALVSLGQGLVRSIVTLYSPMMSLTAAQTWRDLWKQQGGQHEALVIPLRLLDAAVNYRDTQDQHVLLRLPIEERQVLQQILEGVNG